MRGPEPAASGFVNRIWYGNSSFYLPLLPLSWLFALVTSLRRTLYRSGFLPSFDVGKPVIVVGNIVSGGTGKTPVSMWLSTILKDRGFRPGIASRGYGGSVGRAPLHVLEDSDMRVVGDEPLLMARRAICPIVVHPDRVAAATMLIEMGCDVIVADDGLQHYRLQRQFEIAVVDGARGFGNARLLPAGPLREPVSRLNTVNQVMLHGDDATALERWSLPVPCTRFELSVTAVHDLQRRRTIPLEQLRGKSVHAIAAIGNPQRFFHLLSSHGIIVLPHALPDHASISHTDLDFGDGLEVLMTEKDAVKVTGPVSSHWWYVAVDLTLCEASEPAWLEGLIASLKSRQAEQ